MVHGLKKALYPSRASTGGHATDDEEAASWGKGFYLSSQLSLPQTNAHPPPLTAVANNILPSSRSLYTFSTLSWTPPPST